ncbi:MAG: hypothetical protein Q4D98_02435 [Planctomycetia bacterium]|nr:hypothetical protein [Planctomycetia bacterium]
MNAETRWIALWNASETLKSLLPTESLSTGWSARDTFPYGIVSEKKTEDSLLTNAGFLRQRVTVELAVYSDSRNFLDVLFAAITTEWPTFPVQEKKVVPTAADTWKLTATFVF